MPVRSVLVDTSLHPLVKILASLSGVATALWVTWCTVIAFVGGTMLILGWETDGGIGFGLLRLFVLEPLAITVAYWITALVLVPIALLVGRKRV